MKYFAKALRQAWRHWPALTLAILCSLGVAALWGANIAAIFPIIQTTLNGETLQSWNQKRLDTARQKLKAHETEIADSEKRIATATDPAAKRELAFKLDMVRSQIKVDNANIRSAEWMQPFFDHYMPA